MTELAPPKQIDEIDGVDRARFESEVRPAGKPKVLRGLASHWPAVAAARQSDEAIARYLISFRPSRLVSGVMAPPDVEGRFFYNDDMTGFNFARREGALEGFLAELLRIRNHPSPPAIAVQSAGLSDLLPGFADANAMPLLEGVEPRIWLGNRIRVAPHYDPMENIAVCLAGRRRFTLFPPEQLPNLYPGPLEFTPAGAPISMVDPRDPDLQRYPRFREAWDHALQTTLEPGDALYIPYAWWHGVESLDPVSFLVNYWWVDREDGIGDGFDAFLHAVLSYRHLPEDQRRVWKALLDHYVFEARGNPANDWPPNAHGIMGPPAPALFTRIRQTLLRNLSR